MMRSASMAAAIAIGGCGPSVPIDPAAETSTTRASDGDDDDGSPTTATPTSAPTSADEGTSAPGTSTTTGSSSTTEDWLDDDSSEEVTFIEPPDPCFTHCVMIECDLWAQDCMDGEKCMAWDDQGGSSWNATRCSPIAEEPGMPGESCTVEGSAWSGIDDCQMLSKCWDVDPETNAGTCAAFCSNSRANPLCEGDAHCFLAYDGYIFLCLPPCDPLLPSCEVGFACVESYADALPDTFACVPDSLVADRSQYADACDELIGCGTGLLCTVPTDVPACESDCCTTLCDPLAANTCPDAAAGQVCIAHAATPTLGHCGFP